MTQDNELIKKRFIELGRKSFNSGIFTFTDFLGLAEQSAFDEIKKDLAEVQAMYENSDSILIVPISVNYLESMKIIGQNLDIDIIANKKNTLFF